MQKIILVFLINIMLVACTQTPKQKSSKSSQFQVSKIKFQKGSNMDKKEFWKIIAFASNKASNNSALQEKLIIDKLVNYTPEQIIEFEIILRQLILEADDFKIMAAEKIIEGWVTDDPYLYFRCWLISQGENTFYQTIKNPDFLADIINKDTETNFESLLYVATEAYKQKTGKEEEEDDFPRNVAVEKDADLDYDMGGDTKGDDWESEDLPELYPKLCAKFNFAP